MDDNSCQRSHLFQISPCLAPVISRFDLLRPALLQLNNLINSENFITFGIKLNMQGGREGGRGEMLDDQKYAVDRISKCNV